MAAFFWDGFDLYGTGANCELAYNGGSQFGFGTSTNARTGTNSINANNLVKAFGSNLATVWAGFAYKGAGTGGIVKFRDSGTVQFDLTAAADGSIKIQRGATLLDQSAIGLVSASVYCHIIVKATVHNSSGAIEVYVNETLVADCSGVDTANGTANNYSNQIELVGGYFDDLWLSDQNEGDCRVIEQLPTADSATHAAFGVYPSGSHFALVDDTTPDTTSTYVTASVLGTKDAYTFPALGVTGDVKGVKAVFNCAGDVGSVSLRPFLRVSSADYTGNTESVNTTWTFRGNDTVWTTNPAGGAWSQAAAEAAEVGVEKR